jgi:phosphate transport system protein
MMKMHFIHAIDNLKLMIAQITAKVEHSVYLAVNAVKERSVTIARNVIINDAEVNNMEIKIEEECLKILALYQPVAGDLRQVITILKINNEIERIGDLAVNIAERVPDMATYNLDKIENFEFDDMVDKVTEMLRKSLDSMTYYDVITAAEVIRLDDGVDEIHRDNYRKTREMILKHSQAADYYLDCLTVSRCLERIADSATNIAEDMIYLESGKIVRHLHDEENNK